jgi:hypothetical protein
MTNPDFELVMAEAHRLRREAHSESGLAVRQVLEDAAERLEILAQRLERETTVPSKWTPEYRSI